MTVTRCVSEVVALHYSPILLAQSTAMCPAIAPDMNRSAPAELQLLKSTRTSETHTWRGGPITKSLIWL